MKTGVLLVNFGGPRSLEEVPDFLTNMMGRERAQAMLAPLVDRYRAIGGGSPLAAITDEQAALLEREMGKPFPIHAAYQYSHPSIGERIGQACASGVERLAFLAMSPFSSSLTTGAYLKAIETSLDSLSYRPAITFISGWCNESAFVDCWAEKIKAESTGEESYHLFSAHSLPCSCSDEPYKSQVEETVQAVAQKCGFTKNYGLAWQSVPQGVKEPWIGPSVERMIDSLAGRVKKVVEIPIGFVSDHLETWYDMDIVHRAYATTLGFEFLRISSLNTYDKFIAALARILEKALGEKG